MKHSPDQISERRSTVPAPCGDNLEIPRLHTSRLECVKGDVDRADACVSGGKYIWANAGQCVCVWGVRVGNFYVGYFISCVD